MTTLPVDVVMDDVPSGTTTRNFVKNMVLLIPINIKNIAHLKRVPFDLTHEAVHYVILDVFD